MAQKSEMRKVVALLQAATSGPGFTAKTVGRATELLAQIGYSYNTSTLPALPANHTWDSASPDVPRTLAEALLWKMGKWSTYQSFASHYANADSQSKGTDVVFYGFARHLRNQANPIYDQHAMRALWAVDSGLTQAERAMCRSLLFVRADAWKPFANGRQAINCYTLFVNRIAKLSSGRDMASKNEIDKLLMPLGQALKASTSSYEQFRELCGWQA